MSSNSFLYRQTPNLITIARIALVPIVIWLLAANWNSALGRWIALALFVLAAVTDGVDGSIARARNLVSDLGKILDPIADKALLSGALVALSLMDQVSWWITGLILTRELGITIWRLLIIRNRVVPASSGGKLKTVLQIVAISLVIAPLEQLGDFYFWLTQLTLWFATALTIVTGISYIRNSK